MEGYTRLMQNLNFPQDLMGKVFCGHMAQILGLKVPE